jgi:hypothetical protein
MSIPSEIYLAIFFGGVSVLAQYLPARWGIPIALIAIVLSVWQLGWGVWPLLFMLVLTGLLIWRIIAQRGLLEKDKEKLKIAKKERAYTLHKRIMELDSELEGEKDKLTSKEKWKENSNVRRILDELQITLNDLGYLVNSRDYDRWVEAIMSLHSKKLEFHYKEHEAPLDEWSRARINAKLRDFIKKV